MEQRIFYGLILLLTFSFLKEGAAQNGIPPNAGARGLAMGQTGLGFRDINSIFSNPSGLGYLSNFSATAFAEQRFLISEIKSVSAAAAYPTNSGTFGLSLNYFGFEAFNEQRIGLAYGRKLFDNLAIGGQIVVLNTRIPEYGSRSVITFELGFTSQIVPELLVNGHLYSPVRVELTADENLPSIYAFGISYLPSNKVIFNLEVEKDIDYPVRVKAGLEYKVIEAFAIRLGILTEPTAVSFGIGYQISNGLTIDFASSYHQVLGFTPGFSITYNGKKRIN